MFKIIKKYRHLLSRRAADDFNRMAAFLTNICGDQSIDFHRPDEPTAENPPSIRVNEDWLDDKLENLPPPEAPTNPQTPSTGNTNNTNVNTQVTWSWAPGENSPGLEMQVVCRGTNNGASGSLFFATLKISKDGRISLVNGETDQLPIATDLT